MLFSYLKFYDWDWLIVIFLIRLLFCSFIVLTGKIIHEISLVEVVGCTLDICLLGYYVITVGISWKIYAKAYYSAVILEYGRICM